jgi:hypothetical protein
MANSAKKMSLMILPVIFCIFAQANPVLSENSGMTVKGDVNGDGIALMLPAAADICAG